MAGDREKLIVILKDNEFRDGSGTDIWNAADDILEAGYRSPDLVAAQVREAVLAERERIAKALELEAEIAPCAEDAKVVRGCAWLVRADFSYDEADRLIEAFETRRLDAQSKEKPDE